MTAFGLKAPFEPLRKSQYLALFRTRSISPNDDAYREER
jgi:hypothetical protein